MLSQVSDMAHEPHVFEPHVFENAIKFMKSYDF